MLNPDSVGRTFAGAESVTVSQSEIDAFCAVISEGDKPLLRQHFQFELL